MKITMYELLGMLKDGKAPKKIKYNGRIYNYEDSDYFASDCGYLFDRYNVSGILNNEVEILEAEKKIPEKINICTDATNMEYIKGKTFGKNYSNTSLEIAHTINEIIDYLRKQRR